MLWLMKTRTFQMEITKQGTQSLRTKLRNAELNLKGATVIRELKIQTFSGRRRRDNPGRLGQRLLISCHNLSC